MSTKTIKQIITPPSPHWVGNGFFVHGFFNQFSNANSPFLLLDYAAKRQFEPSQIQRGVGSHPHRGFETVTIALSGQIAHHDSSGNSGIIREDGVQWMTAGSGILHQEYFEESFNQKGGGFQMVQLWVNLPKKHKMTQPKYQAIDKNQIPVVNINGNQINIIAGSFEGHQGAASTFSPVEMYTIELKSELKLTFPARFNTMLLVLDGRVVINGQTIKNNHLVIFDNLGEIINLKTETESKILVISGEPLNEPIVHYGPFVMNTEEEIVQAVEDFNQGKFGKL